MEADSQSLSTQSRAIDIQVNYHIDCAMLYSIYLFNKAGDIEQTGNEETILEQRLGKASCVRQSIVYQAIKVSTF